jgi:uncharacterized protein (TIGR02118 family)
MKTISLIGRRADFSSADFQAYYEEKHAPLAVSTLPFAAYRRNHVVARSESLPAFDVMPEFYFDDFSAVPEIMATEAGKALKADELNFMGTVRFSGQSVEASLQREHFARDRSILFYRKNCDASPLQEAAAMTLGNAISIDVVRPYPGGDFPADLLVSVWGQANLLQAPMPGFRQIGAAAAGVYTSVIAPR